MAYTGGGGGALPERGTFFSLQVNERVGISLVEVYKRVAKSVISVWKGLQMHFVGKIKSEKRSDFVIFWDFKDAEF